MGKSWKQILKGAMQPVKPAKNPMGNKNARKQDPANKKAAPKKRAPKRKGY